MKLRILIALLAFLYAGYAHAQGAVQAYQPQVYGHGAMFGPQNNFIMDAGGPTSNGQPPANLSNPGTSPLGYQWVNSGLGDCGFSRYANANNGLNGSFTRFCWGFDGNDNALLAVDGFGTNPSFNVRLNGILYPGLGTGGNMVAPISPAPVAGQMVLWSTNGQPNTKNGGVPPLMISTFGADLTGTNDATTALNNCLGAAGAGGTCTIDRGAIIKALGNVAVPAQTTLDCGVTFTDVNSLAGPSIRLDPLHSILFSGNNAAVHNCEIVPNGMTFPQTSSSAWTGTAINTQGNGSVEIINTQIVGFDVCVNGYGSSRPVYKRVYMDCNGGAATGGTTTPPTSATFVTGNEVDAGFVTDVKIQVIGTGATCPARERQGTGWYAHDSLAGGVFADNVVVQDNQTFQYYLKNYNNFMGGHIWADYDSAGGCAIGSSVGAAFNNVNTAHFDHLNINGTQTGLKDFGDTTNTQSVEISDLFLNGIGQDCVVVGGTSSSAGQLTLDTFRTNVSTVPAPCGRYAINYADDGLTSFVKINHGNMYDVNGGISPYVFFTPNSNAPSPGWQVQIGNITTDLPAGSALIGGNVLPGPQGIASAAALAVKPFQCSYMCSVSGTTSITSITGVSPGDEVTLQFQGILTVTNGNNLRLAGNANFTTGAGSLLVLKCNSLNGTSVVCIEVSRSS